MPENAGNKNSPVRLPEELRRDLRREAFERGQQSGKEPAFGDLLLAAWRAYKSIANSGDSGMTKSGAVDVQKDPATTEESDVASESLHISPGEGSWVQKLLRVLRSGRPNLVSALESNLVAFVEAADAADRIETLEAAGVPADIDQGATGNIPAAAGNIPDRSGDPHQDTGFSGRVKDVLRRTDEITKRKTGRPRKAG